MYQILFPRIIFNECCYFRENNVVFPKIETHKVGLTIMMYLFPKDCSFIFSFYKIGAVVYHILLLTSRLKLYKNVQVFILIQSN